MEALLSVLVGIGLAAATGFRIFVPPLVLSLAARSGHAELPAGLEWITSDVALVTLAVATLLEVGAYYVPWLDNLLDSVATPTAVVAGVLMTAAWTAELSPLLRWVLALLAGGGTAAIFQGLTAGTRGISSVATLGSANPILATLEASVSFLLTVLAVLAPVMLALVLGALFYFAVGRIALRRRRAEA